MTNNDYIAEYIKEKHPALLGVDFAFWKFGKIISNVLTKIVDIFNTMPVEYYEGVMSRDVKEECDSKSSDR